MVGKQRIEIAPERLRALASGEVTMAQMAKRLGVSLKTIQNRAREFNTPVPTRWNPGIGACEICGKISDKRFHNDFGCPGCFAADEEPTGRDPDYDEQFAVLWNAGVRVDDIALRYGCVPATISRWARDLGLPSRKRAKVEPEPEPVVRPDIEIGSLERQIAFSGGRYADLIRIAEANKISVVKAQQIWHRLRAAAAARGQTFKPESIQ